MTDKLTPTSPGDPGDRVDGGGDMLGMSPVLAAGGAPVITPRPDAADAPTAEDIDGRPEPETADPETEEDTASGGAPEEPDHH
ncbi:MAG: hypothetical protein ABW040_04900 [Microbacteriaceae bacterium]